MATDISLELLHRHQNRIVWNLNALCNYRCSYCFFPPEVLAKEHPAVGKYTAEHMCESFDRTGREWLVLISGGEPFLHKEFIPLAKGLTRNHYIQVTTNLSRPIHEFTRELSPERVVLISASLHVADREERGSKAVQEFVDRVLFLQDRGFVTLVNYVTHPPLLPRMKADFEYLASKGVQHMTTLTFRGEFEGRMYPSSYTDDEVRLITDLAVDRDVEVAISAGLSFTGRVCDAGGRYFQMDPAGNLHRCCSILEDHGNLFEGTHRFDDVLRPCTAAHCQDASLGLAAVHPRIHFVKRALPVPVA